MYRQGDLLIVREEIPPHASRDTNNIVQLGEETGHAHELIGGDVFGRGSYLLVTEGPGELVHPEHETITLPEGEYRVLRQREERDDGDWGVVSD